MYMKSRTFVMAFEVSLKQVPVMLDVLAAQLR